MQHVSFEYFNQHDMVIAANVSIDFCFVYQNPILISIFNSIFRISVYILIIVICKLKEEYKEYVMAYTMTYLKSPYSKI